MDSRQDIGLGGAAFGPQAYGIGSVKVEPVAVTTGQETGAGSVAGATRVFQDPLESYHINPRTVLDPDLYVNVAQFAYGENIEFQVPSHTQIEAYRRGQNAQEDQVDQQQQQIVEMAVTQQEATDGDGVGGGETQATGTVAAAAVSQALPPAVSGIPSRDDSAAGRLPGNGGREPTQPRHQLEVEA